MFCRSSALAHLALLLLRAPPANPPGRHPHRLDRRRAERVPRVAGRGHRAPHDRRGCWSLSASAAAAVGDRGVRVESCKPPFVIHTAWDYTHHPFHHQYKREIKCSYVLQRWRAAYCLLGAISLNWTPAAATIFGGAKTRQQRGKEFS